MLSGLLVVMERPTEVLDVVLAFPDPDSALQALMTRFAVDEVQAGAILDIQFRRLTDQYRHGLRQELTAVEQEIQRLGG